MSRGDDDVGKRGMVIDVPSKRKRDRPKQRHVDSIKDDLRGKTLSGEETQVRAA